MHYFTLRNIKDRNEKLRKQRFLTFPTKAAPFLSRIEIAYLEQPFYLEEAP